MRAEMYLYHLNTVRQVWAGTLDEEYDAIPLIRVQALAVMIITRSILSKDHTVYLSMHVLDRTYSVR